MAERNTKQESDKTQMSNLNESNSVESTSNVSHDPVKNSSNILVTDPVSFGSSKLAQLKEQEIDHGNIINSLFQLKTANDEPPQNSKVAQLEESDVTEQTDSIASQLGVLAEKAKTDGLEEKALDIFEEFIKANTSTPDPDLRTAMKKVYDKAFRTSGISIEGLKIIFDLIPKSKGEIIAGQLAELAQKAKEAGLEKPGLDIFESVKNANLETADTDLRAAVRKVYDKALTTGGISIKGIKIIFDLIPKTREEIIVGQLKELKQKAKEAGLEQKGIDLFNQSITANEANADTSLKDALQKIYDKSVITSGISIKGVQIILNLIPKVETESKTGEDNSEEEPESKNADVIEKIEELKKKAIDADFTEAELQLIEQSLKRAKTMEGYTELEMYEDLQRIFNKAKFIGMDDDKMKLLDTFVHEKTGKSMPEVKANVMFIQTISRLKKLLGSELKVNSSMKVDIDKEIKSDKKADKSTGPTKITKSEYSYWIKGERIDKIQSKYESWMHSNETWANKQAEDKLGTTPVELLEFEMKGLDDKMKIDALNNQNIQAFRSIANDEEKVRTYFLTAFTRYLYYRKAVSNSNEDEDSLSSRSFGKESFWDDVIEEMVRSIYFNWNYMYVHLEPHDPLFGTGNDRGGNGKKKLNLGMPIAARERAVNQHAPLIEMQIAALKSHLAQKPVSTSSKKDQTGKSKPHNEVMKLGYMASEIDHLMKGLKAQIAIKELPKKEEIKTQETEIPKS
ncbi:MAG: hypothetical protein AAF502_16105 [Bacteroidota bacterium]